MKLHLLATVAFLALTPAAMAADAVDARIQDLFSQGYTHFSVHRGTSVSSIEAYGANLPKLEMSVSSSTGDVLNQYVETGLETSDHSAEISRINAASTGYSDDVNGIDDDGLSEGTHELNDHSGVETEHYGTTGTHTESEHYGSTGTSGGTTGSYRESDHDYGSDLDHSTAGGSTSSGTDTDHSAGGMDHDSGSDHDSDHGDDD